MKAPWERFSTATNPSSRMESAPTFPIRDVDGNDMTVRRAEANSGGRSRLVLRAANPPYVAYVFQLKARIAVVCLMVFFGFHASAGQEGLQIEAEPAWGGLFQVGRMTEIEVRLYSPRQGTATIELLHGDRRIDLELAMEAGTPRTLHVPLTPAVDSPLLVRAALPGEKPAQAGQNLTLSPTDSTIVAVASASQGADEEILPKGLPTPDGPLKTLVVSGTALPGTVQGYGAIDALILDYGVLGGLDRDQMGALYHYLAQCGRLIVRDFPDAALDKLRSNAGCRGEFLEQTGAGSVAAALQHLLEREPAALPSRSQLQRLTPEETQNPVYRPVLALTLGYFSLLAGVARVSSRSWPLFALPLFASILALLAWSQRAPTSSLSVWMETANGQGSARFGALLRTTGMGRWQDGLELPVEAAFSANAGSWRVNLDAQSGNPVNALAQQAFYLLSRNTWDWRGSLALRPPLVLAENDGRLTVANVSRQALPGGWVGWNGAAYAMPSLAPGENWSPQPENLRHPGKNPLLHRLHDEESAAALIPFFPGNYPLPGGIERRQGWLLIRAASVVGAG